MLQHGVSLVEAAAGLERHGIHACRSPKVSWRALTACSINPMAIAMLPSMKRRRACAANSSAGGSGACAGDNGLAAGDQPLHQ